MKTANLLIDCDFLLFDQPEENITKILEDFFLAHGKAREFGDKVYNSSEIWRKTYIINGEKYGLIETLSNFSQAKMIFPWLSLQLQQSFTQALLHYPLTKRNASNLQELEEEFPNENNGILGVNKAGVIKRVHNIPSLYHLHVEYLKQYPEFINWEENGILPLTEYSNMCIISLVEQINPNLNQDEEKLSFFQRHYIRTLRNNTGDLIDLATEIASRNCYEKDSELSSSESKLTGSQRLIFKINKHGEFQYISLDFENGQWEVCNEKGEHLGVYNFSGIQTANTDTTGNHDILTLRN